MFRLISTANAMKNKPAKFAQASKRTLEWAIYNVKGYLNTDDRFTFEIVHVLRFGNGLKGILHTIFRLLLKM